MATNSTGTYSISRRCENEIKQFIRSWFTWEDAQRRVNSIIHVSIEDAYERILYELSTMEDRDYAELDAPNPSRSPMKNDCRQFVISEILPTLDLIYQTRVYYPPGNDDLLIDDNYSGCDEQSSKWALCTPKIAKIRLLCAHKIWRKWSDERHWGPRVGVILISTMEEGAEKVLLVSYIKKNIWSYGFPKGKPNRREKKREGCFREFKEETGVDDLNYHLQINEDDGGLIKKYPYIGPIARRRSRTHYYIITTTSTEFKGFRPRTHEISDVEWHSVYMLPCCDGCLIKRRFIANADPEISINYHMVTLRDINNENCAVLDILAYIDAKNGNQNAYKKYIYTHRKCGKNLS